MVQNIAALIGLAVAFGFPPIPRSRRLDFPEIIPGKSTKVDRFNPFVLSAINKAESRRQNRNQKRLANWTGKRAA